MWTHVFRGLRQKKRPSAEHPYGGEDLDAGYARIHPELGGSDAVARNGRGGVPRTRCFPNVSRNVGKRSSCPVGSTRELYSPCEFAMSEYGGLLR